MHSNLQAKSRLFLIALTLLGVAFLAVSLPAAAQQTLGGITGTVVDPQGSAIPGAEIKAVSDDTKLVRSAKSNAQGTYQLNDLPIGKYTVTVTMQGFSTEKFPGILVQADRTDTLPAQLAIGGTSDSVTVDYNPLLNAVDTTNGYVLDKEQIQSIPLPTGSFTGVAILSPGVNAELPGGTGVNSGLGNAPIWANGERDTSNSFLLNGVDASNLFNGKSTSQVASGRVVNSTGVGNSGGGGVEQSSASVYLSIGNAIPSPAPETIQEVKVNASMYDASQGSTSGAHIDISTASGTNQYHGTVYGHRGTNWLNAAPYFFKQDPSVPASDKNPQLHRYILGGTFGGPIIKNKLFGFIAYQHLHVSDQEIGDGFFDTPPGLTSAAGSRTAASLLNTINNTTYDPAATVDPTALALLTAPNLPGEPCCYLVPSPTYTGTLDPLYYHNTFLPGTAYFTADQAVGDIDYNLSNKDTLALKYYYQHDPTTAPYAYSNVPGFTQHLDAGAQEFSLSNAYLIKSNLSTQETVGFMREKIYSTNAQPFGPSNIPGGGSINTFGSNYFPGVSIVDALGSSKPNGVGGASLFIGPNATSQGSNTGVFQNRIMPSANAIWTLGRHNVSFGGSYGYTQLNTIDRRTGTGSVAATDAGTFLQGIPTPNYSYNVTTFLQGNANRYYRANQVGLFIQDKFQVTPTLTITAGLRYDWDGGLSEKNGRIFNFDPKLYNYDSPTSPTLPADVGTTLASSGANSGFIIAGNNANGTPGVSKTTLTGRQWGIAPRVGAAWQPKMFDNKVVVRAGSGIYYDRGELFSYFSPGYALGLVTGGPFGGNQQLPFVNTTSCTPSGTSDGDFAYDCATATLEQPYGPQSTAPKNASAAQLAAVLPNATAIQNGAAPVSLGVYDRANKLPYSINYTLDVQWQPRNDLAIQIGYVGNLGRHQVIPVPFNQPQVAYPTNGGAIHGQSYTYGFTPQGPAGCTPYVTCNSINLPNGQPYLTNYEDGNLDLRVPYIGYAAESIDYKAAGVASYNALTAHVEKRMSKGIQVGASYTYSHALDEQSALGLFYNGNNPLNLRDGYASGDFDRTHVFTFNYVFQLPKLAKEHSLTGDFVDGWSLVGLTVLQSGQPYSIVDYSSAVGSIYYSINDGITNPIVPLDYSKCTPKSAKTGASGAYGINGPAALNPACFYVPVINKASDPLYAAIPAGDTFETEFTKGQRNIFRQTFQKRADASLVKVTQFSERYSLKYTFDVYNLTNTTSLDIPGNEITQNQYFDTQPIVGEQATPTGCTANGNPTTNTTTFFNCGSGLGYVSRAIGSPRQIQMSLHFLF